MNRSDNESDREVIRCPNCHGDVNMGPTNPVAEFCSRECWSEGRGNPFILCPVVAS